MNFFETRQHQQYNILSTTNAIGWSAILNGFGGRDTPKIEYHKLLPIQLEPETSIKSGYKPTDKTLKVIKNLFYTNRLSRKILIDLATIGVMKLIEEGKKLK